MDASAGSFELSSGSSPLGAAQDATFKLVPSSFLETGTGHLENVLFTLHATQLLSCWMDLETGNWSIQGTLFCPSHLIHHPTSISLDGLHLAADGVLFQKEHTMFFLDTDSSLTGWCILLSLPLFKVRNLDL